MTSCLAARLAGGLLAAATVVAHADTIDVRTPEQSRSWTWIELDNWHRERPRWFNRTDTACREAVVGDACRLPADWFHGGGAGHCGAVPDYVAVKMDLVCQADAPPRIDHQLPDSPWQVDAFLCTHERAMPCEEAGERIRPFCGHADLWHYLDADDLARWHWQCEPPPVAAEDVCRGHAAGDACVVTGLVAGRPSQGQGVCREHEQVERRDAVGVLARRRLLTCESPTPPDDARFDVPLWRRILRAFVT